MAHPEAHRCEVRKQGQHWGKLIVLEDGSKICVVHFDPEMRVEGRFCAIVEPGAHHGFLGKVDDLDVCTAHRRCMEDEPGKHGGERLHALGRRVLCENHVSANPIDSVDVIAQASKVVQRAEEEQPLPLPPTPRSMKNVPQRGRPRVKSKRR